MAPMTRFAPRGPLVASRETLVGMFVVLLAWSAWGWHWGVAAALAVVVLSRLVRRRRVITFGATELVLGSALGSKVVAYGEVDSLSTQQFLGGRKVIQLVVRFTDGSTRRWPWISYSRTAGGNFFGIDALSPHTHAYLSELAEACASHGVAVDFAAFDHSALRSSQAAKRWPPAH